MLLQKVMRSFIIGILIAIPTAYLSLGAGLSGFNEIPFGQALGELSQQAKIGPTYITNFIIVLLAAVIVGVVSQSSTATASSTGSKSASSGSSAPVDGDREYGAVKWFNSSKGFGFITRDQGDDIFVHYRSIRGEGHRSLKEGQKVDFIVTEGEKGLQAEDVIPAAK